MRSAIKKGLGFGLTSGIITTLGLMMGLSSSTHSKIVVLGGIITIAIADSMSDAFGIHMSEEAGTKDSKKQVFEATISTFITKFILALTFVVPFLITELYLATIVCIIYGVLLLGLITIYEAHKRKDNIFLELIKHLSMLILVLIITYYVGIGVSTYLV
ncbi:hypothetical protein K9L67_04920 [Candidatus Woesearchaeota archaeon]|nr:hypothetical protein [Candidatus Woesearchaeota archaeon]MCF7901540.1 hypothetical protein [Candidatus Woesearchaeota archaeon]MCF8013964.1 hypothetical protein [Candidatus Woesearchaeota archaeon]